MEDNLCKFLSLVRSSEIKPQEYASELGRLYKMKHHGINNVGLNT
jgi:hypothetical protein